MLLDIVRPLQTKPYDPIKNELSVFAVDTVGSHICEIQPLMCCGQHSEIYDALMPVLKDEYGITNIAVVLPEKDPVNVRPGYSERLESIDYITVGELPTTADTLLLSFRVSAETMKARYSDGYKYDTSTDEASLSFAANQHKIISRMLISSVNPQLNPPFWILDPEQTYAVETLKQTLGSTIVLKSPTQSRGVDLLVLHDPSQETFDQALHGYREPLILAETFVKNIQMNVGEERQTSVRYFVLFDGETQKATVFAKRNDYAETQFPQSEDTLTNKSAICHSSLASDFKFVSDFSPNAQELRLENDLGPLIAIMKSTTPRELVDHIHNSEHKEFLRELSNTVENFWIHLKLTNFFGNLGIRSSGLDILKTKSGQSDFKEQYLALLSTVHIDIDSDIAEKWAYLRLGILDVAKEYLTKDTVSEIASEMGDLFHAHNFFQNANRNVIGVYGSIFRELAQLVRERR